MALSVCSELSLDAACKHRARWPQLTHPGDRGACYLCSTFRGWPQHARATWWPATIPWLQEEEAPTVEPLVVWALSVSETSVSGAA